MCTRNASEQQKSQLVAYVCVLVSYEWKILRWHMRHTSYERETTDRMRYVLGDSKAQVSKVETVRSVVCAPPTLCILYCIAV